MISNSSINPSDTFQVPGTAVLNTPLRMRVVSESAGTLPSSCSDIIYGQGEDYTVTIVAGNPVISLSVTNVYAGMTMANTSTNTNFTIYNNGSDPLIINNIQADSSQYTFSMTNFTIAPGDSQEVTIIFTPTSADTTYAVVSVLNTDNDTSFSVWGIGTGAPVLDLDPTSFNVTLNAGDSSTYPLYISNIGDGQLTYDNDVGNASGNSLIFADGFEDGTMNAWTSGPGTYTKQVISTTSANGTYSLNLDGGQSILYDGVYHVFNADTPDYIGLYIRTNSTSDFSCLIGIGDDNIVANNGIINWYFDQWGTISSFATGSSGIPYNANQWYHIEFKNIDFNTFTYDFYLDDSLRITGQPFNSTTIPNITQIHLFNYSSSAVSYFDDVSIGGNGNNTSLWLSANPDAGSVVAPNTDTIDVKFNGKGLYGGIYTSELSINTSDPLNTLVIVPCTLNVVGIPSISLSNAAFNMDTALLGTTVTRNLTIYNPGSDSLVISGIVSDSADFYADTSSFTLAPGDSQVVIITFKPIQKGAINSYLRIYNNDADTFIILTGVGLGAPIISLNPTSFNVALFTGDSATEFLTISNVGDGMLNYSIDGGSSASNYDSSSTIVYTTSGATTTHNFTIGGNPDSVWINITINGDFDSSNEYADLSIDGNNIKTITDNNVSNGIDIMDSVVVTGAQLATWLSDGVLSIQIDNSSDVGTFVGTEYHIVRVRTTAGSTSWITLSSNTGSVSQPSTDSIKVLFIASGLMGGTYTSNLTVITNDSLNPQITIPCTLVVTGIPIISLSSTVFNFDSIMKGTTKTDTLTITNNGTDSLHITNVSLTDTSFLVDITSFSLYPGESQDIIVTFSPYSITTYSVGLTIYNNDADTIISLIGIGLGVPDISVNPSSFNVTISTGDSTIKNISISNIGDGNLDFDIKIGSGYGMGGDTSILVIQNSIPWSTDMYTFLVDSFGVAPTMITSSQISSTDFSLFDIIITVGAQSTSYYNEISAEVSKFETFVGNGGIVQYQMATQGASNINIVDGVVVMYATENNNNILLPTHPIVAGLSSPLQGSSASHCYVTNLPGNASIIAETSISLEPTIVEYTYGSGVVIATGMTWEWLNKQTGNSAKTLLRRAVSYSISLLGSNSKWLSTNITTGTNISGGATVIVDVKFNAKDLLGGIYISDISITTNDPDSPVVVIPCTLKVMGIPVIQLSANNFDFGDLTVGASKTFMLSITNPGTDSLIVSNIVSNEAVFTVNTTNFSLYPGDTQDVIITFAPSAINGYSGTLTIYNNDQDKIVSLAGVGIGAPVISVDPTSFNVVLFSGDTSILPFTIYNSGLGLLNTNIQGSFGTSFDSTSRQKFISTGEDMYHTFSGLSSNADSVYINIRINGDYNSSTEYVSIYIDGTYIGQMDGGVNYTNIDSSFAFGSATVSGWLADGQVIVLIDNSSNVDPGYGTDSNIVQLIIPGSDWLSYSTVSSAVQINDSSVIDIKFDARGKFSGLYTSQFTANSNDPLLPSIVVPCSLTVLANPVADFTSNVQSTCTGTITFTDLSINNPTSWLWDFGDGNVNAAKNPTHTYSSKGIYTVTLTVTNSEGSDILIKTNYINYNSGPVGPNCTPTTLYSWSGIGIVNVNFNTIDNTTGDGSDKYKDYTCTQSTNLIEGNTYNISIQTGPSNDEHVRVWIDYDNDGTFNATTELVFSDSARTDHSGTVTIPASAVQETPLRMRVASSVYWDPAPAPCVDVNYGQFEDYTVLIKPEMALPVADFYANVLDSCQAMFQFIDQTKFAPTSWSWNFGDGNTSTQQNPYYTYSNPGTFTVVLTATNTFGSDTYTQIVTSYRVTAGFSIQQPAIENSAVQFTDESLGATTWFWNFGDWFQASFQNPSHVYTAVGTYNVTLSVTNGGVCADNISKIVSVFGVGIDDIGHESLFAIYPNPSDGNLYVKYNFEGRRDIKVQILNSLGQEIIARSLFNISNTNTSTFDLSDQSRGIYTVKLTLGDKQIIRKLVLK
ncbi:DUF1573 domain-containing protein [Bacteroidales bacterium AH-315-N07]|nr:DUF1573 domain-containing protein [Bacteroidales bacterium AH-315-N07]